MAEDIHTAEATAAALLEAYQPAFETFYTLLVSWNEKMNLTAITEREEVWAKHFLDSLLVVGLDEWSSQCRPGAKVADIGTGAGFPGLPLAICHPDLSFVLCDSLQKRVQFLNHVCDQLSLQNVQVVHGRAEDLARQPAFRNQMDVVVSRAVARLSVLEELTMPFVRPGGSVIAYKGPGVVDEVEEGKKAAVRLGGLVEKLEVLHLPDPLGTRYFAVIRQRDATPKAYPRKAGTPQRQPLG